MSKQMNVSSSFKGVLSRDGGKGWNAVLSHSTALQLPGNKPKFHLGTYETEALAAKAYDRCVGMCCTRSTSHAFPRSALYLANGDASGPNCGPLTLAELAGEVFGSRSASLLFLLPRRFSPLTLATRRRPRRPRADLLLRPAKRAVERRTSCGGVSFPFVSPFFLSTELDKTTLVDFADEAKRARKQCVSPLLFCCSSDRSFRFSKGSSSYKGVSWEKDCKNWRAQIQDGERRVRLGNFSSEEEAARAYDTAALRIRGINAELNFPRAAPVRMQYNAQHA